MGEKVDERDMGRHIRAYYCMVCYFLVQWDMEFAAASKNRENA